MHMPADPPNKSKWQTLMKRYHPVSQQLLKPSKHDIIVEVQWTWCAFWMFYASIIYDLSQSWGASCYLIRRRTSCSTPYCMESMHVPVLCTCITIVNIYCMHIHMSLLSYTLQHSFSCSQHVSWRDRFLIPGENDTVAVLSYHICWRMDFISRKGE